MRRWESDGEWYAGSSRLGGWHSCCGGGLFPLEMLFMPVAEQLAWCWLRAMVCFLSCAAHRDTGDLMDTRLKKIVSAHFFYQFLSFNVFQGLVFSVWIASVCAGSTGKLFSVLHKQESMEKQTGMSSGLSVSTRLSSIITRCLLPGKADKVMSDSQILGWVCRSDS